MTADTVWPVFGAGGEVADLFTWTNDSFVSTEGPYAVVRIWSNLRRRPVTTPAPAQPATHPYFNVAPRTDQVSVGVAQSIKLDLNAFSDGPTPDWAVTVLDVSSAFAGTPSAATVALDRFVGKQRNHASSDDQDDPRRARRAARLSALEFHERGRRPPLAPRHHHPLIRDSMRSTRWRSSLTSADRRPERGSRRRRPADALRTPDDRVRRSRHSSRSSASRGVIPLAAMPVPVGRTQPRSARCILERAPIVTRSMASANSTLAETEENRAPR